MSSYHGASRGRVGYSFDSLPQGNWIRILHLEPAARTQWPLIGHFESLELANWNKERHREYQALVSGWGTASGESECLLLRGKGKRKCKIRIPLDLAVALRALRSDSDSSGARRLWIDAVCINADDDEERAHQVAQMKAIYGSASRVYVWLDAQRWTLNRYGCSVKEILVFIKHVLYNDVEKILNDPANARLWLTLVQFMAECFSRRWIMQVALAQRATIICVDAKIEWDMFASAVELFIETESAKHLLSVIVRSDKTLDDQDDALHNIDRLGAAILFRTRYASRYSAGDGSESAFSLESLMARLPMYEATRPCDTIYALLSVATDVIPEVEGAWRRGINYGKLAKSVIRLWGDGEEGHRKLDKARNIVEMLATGLNKQPYVVSYSTPLIDIYRYFIQFCIRRSRSLDIICRPWAPRPGTGTGLPESEEDLSGQESDFTDDETSEGPRPSCSANPWVVLPARQVDNKMPSWIVDRQRTAFNLISCDTRMPLERKNADPLVGSPGNRPYQASGGQGIRIGKISFSRRSEHDQSLSVPGFVLDRIAECEQPSDGGEIPASWFEFANCKPDANRYPKDLHRTLIGDRGLKGGECPHLNFLFAHKVALYRHRSIAIDRTSVIDKRDFLTPDYVKRVREVIWGRRLAKMATPIKIGRHGTQNARLALVPKDAISDRGAGQDGDLICILYGLSVPVVLRKHLKTNAEKEADRQAREQQLPEAYQKAVRCIEKFWGFHKELEKAIYLAMDEVKAKGQFSKIWLDKIRVRFDRKPSMDAETTVCQTRNPQRLGTLRTKEFQDRLWKSMCDEWNKMLEDGNYKLRSDNFQDTPITIPLKTGHDKYYYKVIGEAYVDRMMDGQALVYKQEKKIKDTVFELR